MKRLLCVLMSAAMLLLAFMPAYAEQTNDLKFGADGKFTVLQLSDMQDDRYPAYDMLNLVRLSIEETNPDLIIITGDLVEDSRIGDIGVDGENFREGVRIEDIYGNLVYDETLDNVKAAVNNIFSVIEEFGIPYAVAQGNNDYKAGISNEDWLEIYSGYEHCLVTDESRDENGRIDYNLEIKGRDGKTAFNIWIMDTGKNSVKQEQLDWYKSESAALKAANGGKPVESIVFQHINTVDIGNLFEECNFWDEGASIADGKCYRLNKDIADGFHAGAVAPGQTSDEFKAWKECGDVLGAYFGHWHTEGYTGTWDGIELGFTYGSEFAKPGPYGMRVFTIYEDDVANYDSVLYTYEGSVKTNNARFEAQSYEPYTVYSNPVAEFVGAVINALDMLKREIISLLS